MSSTKLKKFWDFYTFVRLNKIEPKICATLSLPERTGRCGRQRPARMKGMAHFQPIIISHPVPFVNRQFAQNGLEIEFCANCPMGWEGGPSRTSYRPSCSISTNILSSS